MVQTKGTLKLDMYADDCILFKTGNNWNTMLDPIQRDLDNINFWCNRNGMQLSTSKSKCLLFGSKLKLGNVDYNSRLNLSNMPLEFVQSYKYLGIMLDSRMDLTELLSEVKKTINGHLFKLRKLRKYISVECATLIYKQTILPLIDYAVFLFFLLNSCNVSDRNDLQVLQNDGLCICYDVNRRDRISVTKVHVDAKLLSLEQRREIQLLTLMYKHKTTFNARHIFQRATRGAERYKFEVERYNVVKYKNSPYYKGSELWNSLPGDVMPQWI